MLLALDAMGGDSAPQVPVQAAVEWVKENDSEILLIGKEDELKSELKKHSYDERLIRIEHAEEVVLMSDSISTALLQRKKSSLRKAFDLHKKGEVEGVISAGHSGAMMALSKLVLKTIGNIDRPCIATMFPTKNKDKKMLIADSGGNSECTVQNLAEFALCSDVYLENLHNVKNPRIALLNIGSEPGKGNELTKEAYAYFSESSFNFVGNIEGKELFDGKTDIIICDGFVGNILLKSSQGVFSYLKHVLMEELTKSLFNKLALLMLKSSLKKIYSINNYESYGGALLLGVKGVSIVCHGSSSPLAIKSAVSFAKWAVEAEISSKIEAKQKDHLLPSFKKK